ncbi:hypothetical protein HOLleu_44439 [Holothuria leucospilota]|uniref:Uncharacterized protein n=1 Tax=Holothuria leucospilota TaxID=206669 RepID=A0A9Q0Y9N0_HOLLE|nr:hypothetical protein HOLleu_44439 [Holothuria leucospilota]
MQRDLAGCTETSPWLHPHHVTLESVLSQVKAAANLVDTTKSSTFTVGIFFAVGTSHGLILLI